MQADLEKVIVAVSFEASRLPDVVVQPPEILHLSFTSHHTHTHITSVTQHLEIHSYRSTHTYTNTREKTHKSLKAAVNRSEKPELAHLGFTKSLHKSIRIYMGVKILDANTLYTDFCLFKQIPMASKGFK